MVRKILSIDGGGIKGVFPASFLATIEDSITGNLSDYFDLIVGTSTGGIIALGLGLGFSAKDILSFYEKYGPGIFKGNRFFRLIRQLGFAKYENKALKQALEQTFGGRKLGESKNRLVIPSLNLETGEVYVYKTAHHRRLEHDYKEDAVNVALATSAAPTYFPTHTTSSGIPLIDGGLWANNPIGMAVVEAVGVLEWPRNELKVLSIGCTSESLNIKAARKRSLGRLYWGLNIADVFMVSQSSASFGTAQLLAGHTNVIRIDPKVANKKYGLDTVAEITSLKSLGYSEARKAKDGIKYFFKKPAEKFKPIYGLASE